MALERSAQMLANHADQILRAKINAFNSGQAVRNQRMGMVGMGIEGLLRGLQQRAANDANAQRMEMEGRKQDHVEKVHSDSAPGREADVELKIGELNMMAKKMEGMGLQIEADRIRNEFLPMLYRQEEEARTAGLLGQHAQRGLTDARTATERETATSVAADRGRAQERHPAEMAQAEADLEATRVRTELVGEQTEYQRKQTEQIAKNYQLALREMGIAEGDRSERFLEHIARQDDRKSQRAYNAAQLDNLNANTDLTKARAAQLDSTVQYQLNTARAETMGDLFTSLEDREKHLENMVSKLFGTDAAFQLGQDEGRDAFRVQLNAELNAVKKARQKLRAGEWDNRSMAVIKAELGRLLDPAQFTEYDAGKGILDD